MVKPDVQIESDDEVKVEVDKGGRRVRFSPTREEKPAEAKKIDKKTAKDLKKEKVESNPKVVLGFLIFTLIASGGAYLSRVVPRGLSTATGTKVVELPGGQKPEGRVVDWKSVEEGIGGVLMGVRGSYAVYIYDFDSGEMWGKNENQVMTAASLIKLPVLVALYQQAEEGGVDLEGEYLLKEGDKIGGAGSMAYQDAGTAYTFREMAELMGQQSDNTAFGVVVKKLGTDEVSQTISEIGMANTSYSENKTTAQDVGVVFRGLYEGTLVSAQNSKEILGYLTDTIFEERIPTGVPENVKVAHKVGTEIGVVSDGGIVYGEHPFVVVIMSEGASLEEGNRVAAEISRRVWEVLGR